MAAAAVLTFLDSHCEVNTEWLQPLLQRVKEVSLSVPGGALALGCARQVLGIRVCGPSLTLSRQSRSLNGLLPP